MLISIPIIEPTIESIQLDRMLKSNIFIVQFTKILTDNKIKVKSNYCNHVFKFQSGGEYETFHIYLQNKYSSEVSGDIR